MELQQAKSYGTETVEHAREQMAARQRVLAREEEEAAKDLRKRDSTDPSVRCSLHPGLLVD